MLFKRCPNHHVSPQYLLNFSCCLLSKHYHLLPLLLFLLRFAYIFPTFPSLLSFFLSLFLLYNDLQAILQVTILRLLLLMLVSFISNTHVSIAYVITTIGYKHKKLESFLRLKSKMVSGLLRIFVRSETNLTFFSEHIALLTNLWTGLAILSQALGYVTALC